MKELEIKEEKKCYNQTKISAVIKLQRNTKNSLVK